MDYTSYEEFTIEAEYDDVDYDGVEYDNIKYDSQDVYENDYQDKFINFSCEE